MVDLGQKKVEFYSAFFYSVLALNLVENYYRSRYNFLNFSYLTI